MKKCFIPYLLVLAVLLSATVTGSAANPKREFRGAWLHVIGQSQWQNMSTAKAKKYIEDQLDRLIEAGCNAVIFQVRPCSDALYMSDLEPWSLWLTGKRGKAPNPMWDPMEYAIEQAHRRGMEFHAWLNPYRIATSDKDILPESHIAKKEPYRMVRFDGKRFFDPGYPENRDYITEVVTDIVHRYDVDAIHIDDYFYPYPAAGKRFDADNASYAKYGHGMERKAWRRQNVDLLIEQLSKAIKKEKNWVRFGVSPFGIWRNKANDPRGSESNGLQNYDDLYADVLLWDEKGWVDYLVPQLYWELDTKAAPSRKLIKWWNDNLKNSYLFIGQDVKRTMDKAGNGGQKSELAEKVRLGRNLENVSGNVWWHGYWVTGNYRGVADSLAMTHQSTIAIPPAYGDRKLSPAAPKGLRIEHKDGRYFLSWEAPGRKAAKESTDAVNYVVYEFFPGETIDISDPQTIIALTPFTTLELPEEGPAGGTTFLVTALDRMNRESRPARLIHFKD